jgi:hypothetical protein
MDDRTSVIVIAGPHSLLGTIDNRGLRVLDVLNDVRTDYLQLRDATLRREIDGMCIGQLSGATIPKTAVDFVLLESDKHEAAVRRNFALVSKPSREALILLGDYEIHGTFMTTGSMDVLPALRQEQTAFFPVTSARLQRVSSVDPPIAAAVALINGQKTTLLHLARQTVAAATS